MSGVLVAVVLIASPPLVHVSIRARPMPTSRPLNVDEQEGERSGWPGAGEYVALTVRGRGGLGADGAWPPGGASRNLWLDGIAHRLRDAGVVYAYVRALPEEGSVTVFLRRLSTQ